MILITGGTGFVGSNLIDSWATEDKKCYSGSKGCNLMYKDACYDLFATLKPTKVVHMAGTVGGIVANSEGQYKFCYDNMIMSANIIEACIKFKTSHLLALSSVCVYPKTMPDNSYPLSEDKVFAGEPEFTNAGYAHAKRMMQAQINAARKSFNLQACVLYPANLYGPHDHFGEYGAHVIPDLIHKMYKARLNHTPELELYGTGAALRQFMYVQDLCKIIAQCSDNNIVGDFNCYSTDNIAIIDLAYLIKEVVGYTGQLRFNGQLDGQLRRDVTNNFVSIERTKLLNGLAKTFEWYINNECSNNHYFRV